MRARYKFPVPLLDYKQNLIIIHTIIVITVIILIIIVAFLCRVRFSLTWACVNQTKEPLSTAENKNLWYAL